MPDGLSFEEYFEPIAARHDDDLDYSIFKAMEQTDFSRYKPTGTTITVVTQFHADTTLSDFNIAPFHADDEDDQLRQAILLSLQYVNTE